jgi:hypothetical protein
MATNTVLVAGHASKLIQRQEIAEGQSLFISRSRLDSTSKQGSSPM